MRKTNWGTILIDMTIIIGACLTSAWLLLLLILITGGYTFKE